ncbi:Gfo/Idh/MocA family oxidoreductase [Arenibacter sp. NBRC 103722]|uniref:Gfo/Idh/MocA family oxidoreductase n=1 Tax=Arenibacter sp. NBRC 103722 TaxID=1113929 RepID=UPI00352C54D5
MVDYQKKYGFPNKNYDNYTDFDEIKENKDNDAVYIIIPNVLHKDFTIRVSKAGKHVICKNHWPSTPKKT